ncbi:uncharacterized protein LOC127285690 [Leptopilina boulardi]|uniref:uncharacterized protein LOC127285690 n=1 Tax=Leptopilina boulardi TaxID=63433 RepID=UPI0021F5F97D|nr:uncharacterized protein LOC127285690 [Leptopilina boulardi]
MITHSEDSFTALDKGDCITLSIPEVDRGPLDFLNIYGVIMNYENGVYQIGTKDGLLKGWFPRAEIKKSGSNVITFSDVSTDTLISLREAAAQQSISGGQGFKKCNCKASQSQCKTKRCICFKSGTLCDSRCHQSQPCSNK